MNFLMDSPVQPVNPLLDCDGSQDVGGNMNLWSFDDIPMSAGGFF
jgi:EREBP-like factor